MGHEYQEHAWSLIAKKLSGEASPADLKELEELLRKNPELHYPLQTIMGLWNAPAADDSADSLEQAGTAYAHHLDRLRNLDIDFPAETEDPEYPAYPEPPRRSRRAWWAAAAGCTIMAFTALFLYRSSHYTIPAKTTATPRISFREIATRTGFRSNLRLPDGTHVWLNAGSRLIYDNNTYGARDREVELTGEAFFDVEHNSSKPFIIHTAKVDIKVLGTRFNVRSYPTDRTTEATLVRGSIEVSIKARPSEKIILKPNEKLVVANDDSALHRSSPVRHAHPVTEPLVAIRKPTYENNTGVMVETSWVDDKLIFQDEEFALLAKDMERWYGVTIRFTNPAVESEWRFTGNFQKENIQQALEALKLTAPFTYTIHENQITIYDR